MVLAVLMIGGIFLFPIWFIKLDAPQFPEGGLIMYIWVNKITGYEENTLNSINILNHYIGMKKIVPDAIPELKIIPAVLIAIAIFGLAAAALKKRWLMIAWVAVFILASIIGIYDFYTWLYDYGHNLDPQAPIKVPGMSYQPPLLGVKWLLNFRSTSLPYTGSLFAAISILLAIGGIMYDYFVNRQKKTKRSTFRLLKSSEVTALKKTEAFFANATAFFLIMLLSGCSVQPQPIVFGEDQCHHCKMTIADKRYGAEIVTRKGKVFKYDAIECLVSSIYKDESIDTSDIHSLWVIDFSEPGKLTDATQCLYLQSYDLPSPMGMFLTAVADRKKMGELSALHKGDVLKWEEVITRVKNHQLPSQ
ncbi:MAG TPA: nitrous oxide reductase accessory protein NosL [Chitinophagales bacterium]|nr:nitrous oxide reductase accessory protein NosL [Chitinophagales bacterium]